MVGGKRPPRFRLRFSLPPSLYGVLLAEVNGDITEPWCPLNKDVERKESGGSPSFSFFRPWKEMRKGNDTLALGSGTSSVSFLTSYGLACTF